jgi:hypothetical protein
MAGITTAMCTSFKVELLEAKHNFSQTGGSAFKMALFKAQANIAGTYGAATTNYSGMTADEVASGGGYTTGGNALTIPANPTSSGTTAFTDFNDVSWTSATFTTSGCMIYNSSNSNSAVGVWTFSADQTVSSGTFSVLFPTADASNAIIRLT